MKRIAAVLAILCLFGGVFASALAQEPTPTSIYTRPTPTPWTVNPNTELTEDFAFDTSDVGNFADTVINAYNFLNRDGLVDFIIFLVMSLTVVGLITKLIRSGKDL